MVSKFKFFQKIQTVEQCAVITNSMEVFATFRRDVYEFHRTLMPHYWVGHSFTLENKKYILFLSPNDLIGRRCQTYLQLRGSERVNGRYDIMNLLNNVMNAREVF